MVTEFLDGANDSEKNSFAGHYRNLRRALQTYLLCSERLLILFDSSTINDIVQRKHNVRRRTRFNSLLAALVLAEDYCLADIFCCITPAVLYEMNGRQAIADAKAADDIIDYIAANMADIGLPLSYLGFSNFPQLFAAHRYIEDDQQAILKALRQLNQTDWTVDLSSMPSGAFPLPLAIAEEMVPDINLKYFDAWYVKYVLMMIIERKIYAANKHHHKLRTFAGAHRDTGLASIVKIKGSRVSGLADIEILSSCDLTAQTCGVSPQIAMAISFDDNLNRALWARMNIREPRMVFEGGSDPKRASSAWTYAMWRGSKRHRKLERRWEEFDAAAVEFGQRHLEKFFG